MYEYARGGGPAGAVDAHGRGTCEAVKGYIHWLDKVWTLVAIVSARGGGTRDVRGPPRGDIHQAILAALQVLEGRKKVVLRWGKNVAAGGDRAGSGYGTAEIWP